ncbi:MAG: serine/threonine protein kinase [Planctomycetes bacterium]|nr:serine/threonine protein kinase [Planctomycetota bacterium]
MRKANPMNESRICSTCGQPLSTDAPAGLCPACLFQRGLDSQTMDPAVTAPRGPAAEPLTPAELAPFFPQLEILSCLGRGGMGVVYRARQKSLDRLVALKILAPEREADPAFSERFATEALALARLNHPHIVTIYDFGQAGTFYYLLMEFVDGMNLRDLQQTRRLEPREALAIVPPICEALQFAHDHGIVHRDIKPANLLLDKQGRVKIADFGIATILDRRNADAAEQAAGTPGYAAPEQVSHPQQTDHRADIYSLGVVLYELLTGELPTRQLEPPSKKVQIDVRLDEIVLRALEQNPDRRYAQVSQFKTQIDNVTTAATHSPKAESSTVQPAFKWFDRDAWTICNVPIVGVRDGRAWPWFPGLAILAATSAVVAFFCSILVVLITGHRLADINPLLAIPSLYAALFIPALIVRRALKAPHEKLRQLPAIPAVPAVPPPEWALRMASRSTASRRAWRLVLMSAGFFFTGCFLAPGYEVTQLSGAYHWRSVLTAGWPNPWLYQIQEFNPGQNWQEVHLTRLSFFCGLAAALVWFMFWRYALAEERASGILEPADRVFAPRRQMNADGTPRVDWSHVGVLTGGLCATTCVGLGLMTAGMVRFLGAAGMLPTLIPMAMPPLFVGFSQIVRWSLHGQTDQLPVYRIRPRYLVISVVLLFVIVVALALWAAARQQSFQPPHPSGESRLPETGVIQPPASVDAGKPSEQVGE